MTDPQIAIPSRAPSATTADDTVMPFEVAKLDLRGRVVRLGPAVDEILARHAYPQPVAKLLGEVLVLTVMLGSALKIDGRFGYARCRSEFSLDAARAIAAGHTMNRQVERLGCHTHMMRPGRRRRQQA